MSGLHCITDKHGVTTLTLDRPEQHNALDRMLIDELALSLQDIKSRTRVLVLKGSGASFCAGADINWMKASVSMSDADNRADATALSDMLEALNTFPHPTLAVVHGAAIGGGSGIVACCDITIASDAARFGFSEVRLGLTPATISPYVLAAIGARQARRWFLSAERFDALQAHRMGLVHEVCSAGTLGNQLERQISALLACGPCAQQAAKQLVTEVANRPVTMDLRQDNVERLAHLRATAEAQEGLQAFLEKRKPSFHAA